MTEEQTSDAATPRVRAARAGAAALAATDGVEPVPDRRWTTADGDERLRGVLTVADSDGTVGVQLHVTVAWPAPPLHDLAATLRDDARRRAEADGVTVGDVDVSVHDLAVAGADG